MRGEFVSCPTAFNRRYLMGLQRSGRSIHLHFGAAFAKGLEAMRRSFYLEGANQQNALGAGITAATVAWGDYEDNHPTKHYASLIGALEAYVAQYPLATDHVKPMLTADGDLGTEFSFALPLPINHPQSGEPLLYSGRFDMLARMGNEAYIEDDKTASQLGPSWGQQWRLRAQFTGYVWGASEFGYNIQGAIVRGISILKRGFGHAEVIEQRPLWMIKRWHEQLLRDVNRMIRAWDSGEWDLNLDSSCASYGGCQYQDLCAVEDPSKWLADFEQVHYDPLAVQGA
jgi:hypothetical protein